MHRIRDPEEKERMVYEFIRRQNMKSNDSVSFHQIQRDLGLTSGTLQSIIARCLKPNSKYRIYEALRFSKLTQRTQRVFNIQPPSTDAPAIPDLERVVNQLQNLNQGTLLELDEEIILPLKLAKPTVQVLQELLHELPEFNSLGQLFSTAIQTYLKDHISPNLIQKARDKIKKHSQMEVSIHGE
jgi:hypothetical protein